MTKIALDMYNLQPQGMSDSVDMLSYIDNNLTHESFGCSWFIKVFNSEAIKILPQRLSKLYRDLVRILYYIEQTLAFTEDHKHISFISAPPSTK